VESEETDEPTDLEIDLVKAEYGVSEARARLMLFLGISYFGE